MSFEVALFSPAGDTGTAVGVSLIYLHELASNYCSGFRSEAP